jgi:hypothetical protein
LPGTIQPVSGFWAIFWLGVVLKIPIIALLWLVWWAINAQPEPETAGPQGGGSDRHGGGLPRHPRPPRRGPHAESPPRAPKRVRVVARVLSPTRR